MIIMDKPRGWRVENAQSAPELVIFVGLQASGKSSFFQEWFAATHEHVSKDLLRNNKNPTRRQAQLIEAALVLVGQRVIGIIMEALVIPITVDVGRDGFRAAAKAAELGDPLVADLPLLQLLGEQVEIILRIGA